MSLSPFSPGAATVNIDVSSSSQAIQVNNSAGVSQVRVMNNGSATAWVKFGRDSTVAATLAAGIPIGSGGTEVFTLPDGPVWFAAIAAGSTGKIYATPGAGI